MKSGTGAIVIAMLIISMALVPVASATKETQDGDISIRATGQLGNLYTDGDNDIANADPLNTGTIYVPRGDNTFTVDWKNVNDGNGDGQGAKYVLTVWDTEGNVYTTTKSVDRAGEGTISVSFNSLGSGDAQYNIYCDTHTYFGTDASDQYTGDLDFY